MITRPFLSEYELKDMWLFLVAIMLVVLVVGYSETSAHPAGTEQVDDGATSAQVQSALLKAVGLRAMNVGVVTIKGEVELSGFVKSEAERRKIEETTLAVAGVTSVSNKLVVR